MKDTAENTRIQIELICRLEKNRAFTMNVDEFQASQTDHKLQYIHYLNENNLPRPCLRSTNTLRNTTGFYQSLSHDDVTDDLIMSQLAVKGIRVKDPKELALLYPRDEYDAELDVISAVGAYFEVASTRVADLMPMIFEVVFIQDFVKQLRKALTVKLKLADHPEAAKVCEEYTRDDDDIHQKRMKLVDDRKVLWEALDILRAS